MLEFNHSDVESFAVPSQSMVNETLVDLNVASTTVFDFEKYHSFRLHPSIKRPKCPKTSLAVSVVARRRKSSNFCGVAFLVVRAFP